MGDDERRQVDEAIAAFSRNAPLTAAAKMVEAGHAPWCATKVRHMCPYGCSQVVRIKAPEADRG